jgi:hypothetical protein
MLLFMLGLISERVCGGQHLSKMTVAISKSAEPDPVFADGEA